MVRMPFGKHKGELLEDVPTDYLRWVLRTCTRLAFGLRLAIHQELAARPPEQSYTQAGSPTRPGMPVDWPDVLRRWHRQLCLDFHPDRGGSTEAMQAINAAYDRLRKMVGV